MKTVGMTIELTYDNETMHEEDGESLRWFMEDVLMGQGDEEGLLLFSSLIGDTIGEVKVVGIGAVTEAEAAS